MPKGITGVDISRGLARMLGLQGKFSMAQDEVQVATLQVATLDRSPFQLTQPCGAADVVGAVVAENGYVGVLPSPGVILAIDKIMVGHSGTTPVTIQRLTAANLATIGAPFSSQRLRDFNNVEPPPATGPRVGSLIETNSFAGAVGDEVAQSLMLINDVVVFDFPSGYFLDGSDPSGINMLAVVGFVNTGITASFFCREFRLP